MWRSAARIGSFALATLEMAALLVACSDGGQSPDPQLAIVAGTYAAEGGYGSVLLTTTDPDGTTVDWLAAGGSIRLELKLDRTTAGRIFVPGGDEGGGDFNEDLKGTWALDRDRITLDHEADTFLRDMDLFLEGDRLVGQQGTDPVVTVELVRR